MSTPPARIPEQPWQYPSAVLPGHRQAPQIAGHDARAGYGAVPAPRAPTSPIWSPGPPRGQESKLISPKATAAFILAALGVGGVLFFIVLEAGFSETLVGAFIALIPLAGVLVAVRWLDRWEPEPRLYLFLSFAWGAGVATATAMYLNTKAFQWLSEANADPAAVELIGIGMFAPLTEEILKGGALLALVLWRARVINSSVDLVVYAATIASGFAFTENILYFARGSGAGVLGAVFLGRAIMSPFAHIMFTSATALILATVLFARRRHLLWAFPLGVLGAAGLHAAWNVTSVVAGAEFFTVFLLLHVPIFLTFLVIVVLLRRRERRHIITCLREYSGAGWFAAHEVEMLGSFPQRSQAHQWAKNYGVRAGAAMGGFQTSATQLALNRRTLHAAARKGTPNLAVARATEKRLLHEVHDYRERFHAAAGPHAAAGAGSGR